MSLENCELTIVMPCLNEEKTVQTCIGKAQSFLREHNIAGEILIADNGSTDHSVELAEEAGARVVHVEEKGYGNALRGGFAAAQGRYIIMGDADESYDFLNLMPFVEKLREGYDLVMGNRFKGGIMPGAMPPLHRYLGNPVLSFLGSLFFRTPASDFHCGLRGFSKEAIERMDLQTTGMELASEIVIKASLLDMSVCEVPATLRPDGRDRPPHLRSWRDGWRHLRFMLMFSPRWLFFYPGLILLAVGLLGSIVIYSAPLRIGHVSFDINTLIYCMVAVLVGFNLLSFAVMSRIYAYQMGLMPQEPSFYKFFQFFNLERGILSGMTVFGLGTLGSMWAVRIWQQYNFGDLTTLHVTRIVIPSAMCLMLGVQIIFTSFFLSSLSLGISKTNR